MPLTSRRSLCLLLYLALPLCYAVGPVAAYEDDRGNYSDDDAARRARNRQREERIRRQEEERRDAAERQKTKAEEERKKAEQRRQTEARRLKALEALNDAAGTLAVSLTAPAELKIVAVRGQRLIVAAGQNIGLSESETLRCFSRGSAIMSGGKALGYDETPLGEGKVVEVQAEIASLSLSGQQATPKEGDVCYRARVNFGKLAVLPLLYKGERTKLADSIEARLYETLFSRGVSLLERNQLTRVIAEQKLSDSVLADKANASRIGALAGADSLLLGNVDDLGADLGLTVRVVRVSDAVVTTSRQVFLPKNEFSTAMLAETMTAEDATRAKATGAAESASLEDPAKKADALLSTVEALVAAGQLDEADATFRQALNLKSDLPRAKEVGAKLGAAKAKRAATVLPAAAAPPAAASRDRNAARATGDARGSTNSGGVKNGRQTYSMPNGMGEDVEWVEGKRTGHYVRRGVGGFAMEEGNYVDDERDGLWTFHQINGAGEEGRYHLGEKCGEWRAWGPGGMMPSTTTYGQCPSGAASAPASSEPLKTIPDGKQGSVTHDNPRVERSEQREPSETTGKLDPLVASIAGPELWRPGNSKPCISGAETFDEREPNEINLADCFQVANATVRGGLHKCDRDDFFFPITVPRALS